jgi:hypothetical protein
MGLLLFKVTPCPTTNTPPTPPEDVVESIVPYMPYVLPIGGGILIFLLAFIAVFMG